MILEKQVMKNKPGSYIDGSRAIIVKVLTIVLPGGISETH